MTNEPRVAIIGTGNIAGPYAQDLLKKSEIKLIGVADIDAARAWNFAAAYGLHVYPTVADLFVDASIEIVVNLTSHSAHYAITAEALEHGKHVFSEKPLALTTAEARALVELAAAKGRRLACSPFTLAGEAQQTAWKLIRDGTIGPVGVVYAEVNWGRIESWHPAPASFYEVGPLFDVGVYPLMMLTGMFGPAKSLQSYGKVVYPDRRTKNGTPFRIDTPDFNVTLLELADGTLVRLTANFYVGHRTKQTGIEFHGHEGTVYLQSWHEFNSRVEYAPFGKPFEAVPLVREPYPGTPWGCGVVELAEAIRDNRPHRFSGEHAAHVVEILNAATESMQTGRRVALTSTFTPPPPMEWAE